MWRKGGAAAERAESQAAWFRLKWREISSVEYSVGVSRFRQRFFTASNQWLACGFHIETLDVETSGKWLARTGSGLL